MSLVGLGPGCLLGAALDSEASYSQPTGLGFVCILMPPLAIFRMRQHTYVKTVDAVLHAVAHLAVGESPLTIARVHIAIDSVARLSRPELQGTGHGADGENSS